MPLQTLAGHQHGFPYGLSYLPSFSEAMSSFQWTSGLEPLPSTLEPSLFKKMGPEQQTEVAMKKLAATICAPRTKCDRTELFFAAVAASATTTVRI